MTDGNASISLTPDEITDLRRRFADGEYKTTLADDFGIPVDHISSYIDDRTRSQREQWAKDRRRQGWEGRRQQDSVITDEEHAEIVRMRLSGKPFKTIGLILGLNPHLVSRVFYEERPDLIGKTLSRSLDQKVAAEVTFRYERGDDLEHIVEVTGISVDDITVVAALGNRKMIRQRNIKELRKIEIRYFVAHNADIMDIAYDMYKSGVGRMQVVRELGVHRDAISLMIDHKEKEDLTNR